MTSASQPNGSSSLPAAPKEEDTTATAKPKPAATEPEVIPSNMSTTALEHKLHQLREQAAQHGQILTQKLATSQSGQNLLHMGTSLSTLPPDLHNLLTQLHPVLAAAEQVEETQLQALQQFVAAATDIRSQQRRVAHAAACADSYADLVAAEGAVQRDVRWRRFGKQPPPQGAQEDDNEEEDEDGASPQDEAESHGE